MASVATPDVPDDHGASDTSEDAPGFEVDIEPQGDRVRLTVRLGDGERRVFVVPEEPLALPGS